MSKIYLKENIKNPNFTEPFINRLIIEKPDFKPTLALGVSFACIYHFCNYNEHSDIDDSGYAFPSLVNLLNSLFKSFKSIQSSMLQLKKYYDISSIKDSTGDAIKMVRNSKKIKADMYSINYPDVLISRAIYLEIT